MTKRAVSICTYNRSRRLGEILEGVLTTVPNGTDVFVCDDGSAEAQSKYVVGLIAKKFPTVTYFYGPNRGVGTNKNRALYLMQNHHFSCILEDDLIPVEKLWFETYEAAATLVDIHHFCRVQNREIAETRDSFTQYLKQTMNATPIYAYTPRGDFTFITKKVIDTVGGLNPAFKGAGEAHGEWSARVVKAGLVSHPLGYVDIAEARNKFKQIGDTEGGRWDDNESTIKKQIRYNQAVAKKLAKQDYIHCPLRIT